VPQRCPLSSYPLVSTASTDVAQSVVSRELADSRIRRIGHNNPFQFDMNGVHFGDTLIGWNSYRSHTEIENGLVDDTVAFVLGERCPEFCMNNDSVVCTPSTAAVISQSKMSIRRPAGSSVLVLRTSYHALERRFREITGTRPHGRIEFERKVNIVNGPGAQLRQSLLHVVSQLETSDTLLSNRLHRTATDDLLLTTLLSIPNSHTSFLLRDAQDFAPSLVRRAEEFLEAHATNPIKMQDVFEACGCDRNRLYRAFKQHRGYTPHEFLQSCRLRASRKLLLSPSATDTVSSIAMATGFPHLGRFAAFYKERFGESPSETLRRSR